MSACLINFKFFAVHTFLKSSSYVIWKYMTGNKVLTFWFCSPLQFRVGIIGRKCGRTVVFSCPISYLIWIEYIFRWKFELGSGSKGFNINTDNIVSHMLQSVEIWQYVKRMSAKAMQELRRIERIRRTEILRN